MRRKKQSTELNTEAVTVQPAEAQAAERYAEVQAAEGFAEVQPVQPAEAQMPEGFVEVQSAAGDAEAPAGKKRRHRRLTGYRLKRIIRLVVLTIIAASFALSFLLPTVLTFTNSFMSEQEISTNYGLIFNDYTSGGSWGEEKTTTYRSEKVNLKLIPDTVVPTQYETVLLKSPDYLMKFWNAAILTLPIVVFQVLIALGASYCFARFKGRLRQLIFFFYLILMLMPYQVTLVPNYLVADKLGLLGSRWSIILPGIFAPFSVYLLTKYMKRIPTSLIEAAQLDGAGEWKIFTKICVPICKGPLASVSILVFIDYWNMVEQPLIMMPDSAYHPLSVFLSQINKGEIGLAFAVATIYMVPPILIFLYGEESLVDGIAYSGSVKG